MAGDQDTVGGKPGRKRSIIIGAFVTFLVLGEGVGIYIAMRIFEPTRVDAAKMSGAKTTKSDGRYRDLSEILVGDFKAPWSKSGRTFVYEVSVAVRVNAEAKDAAAEKLKSNESLIADRIVRIVRSAEVHHLEEDGLETIRRQIKYELDAVLGDESIIGEVLIPRYIKFRADY